MAYGSWLLVGWFSLRAALPGGAVDVCLPFLIGVEIPNDYFILLALLLQLDQMVQTDIRLQEFGRRDVFSTKEVSRMVRQPRHCFFLVIVHVSRFAHGRDDAQ